MEIDPSIFRAYDIRGTYPEQIDEETAARIAKTFVLHVAELRRKRVEDLRIVVGRDIRKSSRLFEPVVLKALTGLGITVDTLGAVSTSDFYFAIGRYRYDGGCMLTASHNPPEYGGFKLAVFDAETQGVELLPGTVFADKVHQAEKRKPEILHAGRVNKKDIADDHLAHILSFVDVGKIKPLKVVVDVGNGSMGWLIPRLAQKLPIAFHGLFLEPDETYSRRSPNPLTPGASRHIAETILHEKADVGVMFDVDGDRIFLLDERGNFIRGDRTLLMLARPFLHREPRAGIVYNLICSRAVPELVRKWGGRPIRSEVGYANLSRHMKEEHGLMSGEVSGHFAFRDNYFADSAYIAMVLALQTISEDGRPFSEILKDYSLYARGDEMNLKVHDIESEMDKIRRHYQANIRDEMDGITVEFPDWWFNARPSNTEPLLRITIEAPDAQELQKRQDEIRAVLAS